MQDFVVQGPHHANASIFGEGLVVKRLLGVRGWVAAGQSDQPRLERYPPDRRVVGFWTLGVDGLLPPAVNKDDATETGTRADAPVFGLKSSNDCGVSINAKPNA